MTQLSQQSIKEINNSSTFAEFRDWIFEKIVELNSVDGLSDMTNEEAGEEAKVRLKTISVIKEIFEPVIKFSEKKEPSIEQIAQKKVKYGL